MTVEDDGASQLGVIAAYGSGATPSGTLRAAISTAWGEILADDAARSEAAAAIGVDPELLASCLPQSPFTLEARDQGIGAVETALIVLVVGAAQDLAKDALKDAAKAGLRKLWALVKERVQISLPGGALGPETKPPPRGESEWRADRL